MSRARSLAVVAVSLGLVASAPTGLAWRPDLEASRHELPGARARE